MRLGIPRSLFFFSYNPFWTTFWQELGVDCLVSPPTTPVILRRGLELALDEFCLPVKVHYGHLAYLENHVDLIFSPAFGRWGKRGHFCPKLKAIHDLVDVLCIEACSRPSDIERQLLLPSRHPAASDSK